MKKRLFAVMLVAVMLMAAVVPASAYTTKQQNTADALNELGLFQGMGPSVGYALDQNLTRAQGITLLVRMIGKEAEATSNTYRTPFVDVADWAAGYVGYAYTNAITNGMGPDKFGSDVQLNDYMFLTLVLRALGHSDADGSFVWNNPYALAKQVGLIDVAAADGVFTRGDAVEVFWNAMSAEIVGKGITLAQSLIDQGIFTAEAFAAAEQTQMFGRTNTEIDDPLTNQPEQEQPEQEQPEQTRPNPDNNNTGDDELPESSGQNPGNTGTGSGNNPAFDIGNNNTGDDEL